MQFRKFLTKQLGFTMVELLVVIAIIGILATAVLAALNPVEQLQKGRDTSTRSDSQTLLAAIDRFQATFGCYPWLWDATNSKCLTASPIAVLVPGAAGQIVATADFTAAAGALYQLEQKSELKVQFRDRNSITGTKLWLSVGPVAQGSQASVCFEPESKSARGGGMGIMRTHLNGTLAAAASTCAAAYSGGITTAAGKNCAVCVPQ